MTNAQLRIFASKLGVLQEQRQSLSIHQNIYQHILKTASNGIVYRQWRHEAGIFLWWFNIDICNRSISESDFLQNLEDCILRNDEIHTVLRHLCLYSIIHNGIKPRIYDRIRGSIIRAYGARYICNFFALESCGMLRAKVKDGKSSVYSNVIGALSLSVPYESSLENQDVSSVYAGYTPITARLVQNVSKLLDDPNDPKLKSVFESFKCIPGSFFDYSFTSVENSRSGNLCENYADCGIPAMLVVFIGGCSLAEISCIRKLSCETGRKFTVITTSICNSKTLLELLE